MSLRILSALALTTALASPAFAAMSRKTNAEKACKAEGYAGEDFKACVKAKIKETRKKKK